MIAYLQFTPCAIALTSSPERLQSDVCWLIESATRRISDNSSVFPRIVAFACSRAVARKFMRRSGSFGIGSHQESINLCLSVSQVFNDAQEVGRRQTERLQNFRRILFSLVRQWNRELRANIGRVHTRDDRLRKMLGLCRMMPGHAID